jgi:hypothetical protein
VVHHQIALAKVVGVGSACAQQRQGHQAHEQAARHKAQAKAGFLGALPELENYFLHV